MPCCFRTTVAGELSLEGELKLGLDAENGLLPFLNLESTGDLGAGVTNKH